MISSARRGYDAGKKINGTKRHLAVDVLGLLLTVLVTAASVQDRDAAKPLLWNLRRAFPSIKLAWADSGYAGKLVTWAKASLRLTLQIVKRPDDLHTFQALPRRWVVERTLSWITRHRRTVRDYERLPAHHETYVYWAMIPRHDPPPRPPARCCPVSHRLSSQAGSKTAGRPGLVAHRTPRFAQIAGVGAGCAVPPETAISRNFGCPVFRLVRRQAEALPDLLLDDLRRGPRVHGVDVFLAPEDLQDGVGLVVIVPQPDRERLLGVIFPGDQLSAAHVAPAGDLRAVGDQVVVQSRSRRTACG